MISKLSSLVLAAALLLPGAASAADPALGIWQTEPDRKDLVSHIEIRACGEALCGRVLRIFDLNGKPVTTANLGRELFWDVKPKGGGAYDDGTVYVPLLNVTARARMQLSGDRLQVTGCKGPVCDGQNWRRVR